MMDTVLPVLLAVAVFVVPVFVLSPIIDKVMSPIIESLFENGQLRAIVRRVFRIDAGATLADLPEPRRPGVGNSRTYRAKV
jgi:hypothetical protein